MYKGQSTAVSPNKSHFISKIHGCGTVLTGVIDLMIKIMIGKVIFLKISEV